SWRPRTGSRSAPRSAIAQSLAAMPHSPSSWRPSVRQATTSRICQMSSQARRRTLAAVTTPAVRLTPNLFGVAFAFAGLGQCWTIAASLHIAPRWVANLVWLACAVLWLVIAVRYVHNVVAGGRLGTELKDPIFGPFVALMAIVPMQLGLA